MRQCREIAKKGEKDMYFQGEDEMPFYKIASGGFKKL
jgi:hypothetical protein